MTEFDYVVIGGGAAGCVIAAGLAQDGRFSVVLIESGARDKSPWIHIPATFFKSMASRDVAAVVSEPEPSLDGNRFAVPQGRVLGGGSSVNGMIYMRGQKRDYDDWAEVHGCTGWAYQDVLPVFKSQEANTRLGDPFHGQSGPLMVADPIYKHPLGAAMIQSAIATGLPANEDFNGAQQEGAGWYQITAHKGRRKSAAVAFLRPALHLETLTVLTGHQAQRLKFNGRRAAGVEVIGPEGPKTILARKEIILTAGSFQSPKLLMHSGIGPAHHLTALGIEVIHDAPEVGANYQDHVGAPVTMRLKHPIGVHGADKGLKALRHGAEYALFRRGLLASNLLESGACADTTGEGRPDVQYNFTPFAPGPPGTPPLEVHAVSVNPMTMRPKSRGRLALKDANPASDLHFTANPLDRIEDLDTLRRGIRLARDIFRQNPLAELVTDEIWPGPDVSSIAGSNTLDPAIRKHARTIFHPSGTCRMGPGPASVVDLNLRVNGVTGLRVADCSVMPCLTSGNTNAPTMMIAGRAVGFILADA